MSDKDKPQDNPQAETDTTPKPKTIPDTEAVITDGAAEVEAEPEADETISDALVLDELAKIPSDDSDAKIDGFPDPDPAEDSTPEPDPKPALPPLAPPEQPEPARRGGFFGVFLGGVVAAGLGFAAGQTGLLDSVLPDGMKSDGNAELIAALDAKLAAQSDALAALKAQLQATPDPDTAPIDALTAQIADITGQTGALGDAVTALDGRVADVLAQIEPLDTRLTAVEKQPVAGAVSEGVIEAYEREITKMQEAVATQRSEVEALIAETRAMEADARQMEANAAEASKQAANRITLARIRADLDSGAPFAPLISDLSNNGVDVPAALAAAAEEGTVTMAALRDTFPEAARDALAAARADTAGSDRSLTGFLQRQLGARSVQPRDGTDADAVLSRAEAALTAGQLDVTLSEIDALPDSARAELEDWVALAALRKAALEAADTLAQSLNTN